MDEAFTATLVRTDYAGVLARSMDDTLPPLYNLLLKLVTDIFGYHVPVMKLFSASCMIATTTIGAFLVKKRFGFKASTVYILALTFMPNMLFFGVEIRMYSLGFCFATLSGIYAYECILEPSRKNWSLFTIVSVLSGYSHHFAFVTVGFIYLSMLLYFILTVRAADKQESPAGDSAEKLPLSGRKGLHAWLCCLAVTFVLYLPCLIVTLKQLKRVNGYFSMPDVTPAVFVKYMRYPYTVGFTPISLILLMTVAVLFVRLVYDLFQKRTDGYFALACFLIYYGVLVFGTIVSKLMTANIFVDRYLFFAHGLLWLFFAIEAARLKKPLYIGILILELSIGIVTLSAAYRSEYAPGADDLITYLHENVQEGDILYTIEDAEGLSLSLPFYDERLTNYEELSELKQLAAAHPDVSIWCAVLDDYDYSPAETDGFSLTYVGDFSFDRYTFKLYRMKPKD